MKTTVRPVLLTLLAWLLLWIWLPQLAGRRFLRLLQLPWLQLGALAYVLLWGFWLRRRDRFWQTLDHELAHALFGVLSWQRIRELNVHHQAGGMVMHEGRNHNLFISLAPYFFRLPWWLAVLLCCLIQQRNALHGAQALLGMGLAYALLAIIEEARPAQPDLRQNGLLCSYSWIAALNVWALLLTATLVTGGSVWTMVSQGWTRLAGWWPG